MSNCSYRFRSRAELDPVHFGADAEYNGPGWSKEMDFLSGCGVTQELWDHTDMGRVTLGPEHILPLHTRRLYLLQPCRWLIIRDFLTRDYPPSVSEHGLEVRLSRIYVPQLGD